MDKFKQLKLSEGLLQAIKEAGFKEPSKIQEKSIPPILEGRDVFASSATGSGKTLAFGAGIIEKTKRGQGIQALILTPTRELAEQVAKSLAAFASHHGLRIKEIYGGVAIGPQIESLAKSDIIVGTPGRILDHLKRKTLNLGKIKFLVLDEADKMLDMGFIEDVESIIKACPKERQTLLFSATLSPEIENISKNYMKNAVHIEVEPYVDPSKLKQLFYDVPQDMKFSLLAFLLKKEGGTVMVFCNTRRNTGLLEKALARCNIHALAIHGGLSQNKRNYIMSSFHSQKTLILICTDVAARGLDIKEVSHIYNYDIPPTGKEYIHRIGRTARAGKEGKAISLVSRRDYENFRRVSAETTFKIENELLPQFDLLNINLNVFRRNSFNQRRPFPNRINNHRQRGDQSHKKRYGNSNEKSRNFRGEHKDFRSKNFYRRSQNVHYARHS